MFAIVDIEATGGADNGRITEIAIFISDGTQILEEFTTLLNPQVKIPKYVQKLTGITSKKVKDASLFADVAQELLELIEGKYLVAHNALFDYHILKSEFNRAGLLYEELRICTVDMSKLILPDEESYSLGKLCDSLGIEVDDRHRATGDARATVELFHLLYKTNEQLLLSEGPESEFKLADLSMNIEVEVIESVPQKPGIFKIFDQNNKVVYCGKGKNMRRSLIKLLKRNDGKNRITANCYAVSHAETGNFLIAHIQQIELLLSKNRPPMNRKPNVDNTLYAGKGDFIVIDTGRGVDERSIIRFRNGKLDGYSLIEWHQELSAEEINDLVPSYQAIGSYANLVRKYIDKSKVEKVLYL